MLPMELVSNDSLRECYCAVLKMTKNAGLTQSVQEIVSDTVII